MSGADTTPLLTRTPVLPCQELCADSAVLSQVLDEAEVVGAGRTSRLYAVLRVDSGDDRLAVQLASHVLARLRQTPAGELDLVGPSRDGGENEGSSKGGAAVMRDDDDEEDDYEDDFGE